jgi:hypothetical protein
VDAIQLEKGKQNRAPNGAKMAEQFTFKGSQDTANTVYLLCNPAEQTAM